jgi:hypothetical protein
MSFDRDTGATRITVGRIGLILWCLGMVAVLQVIAVTMLLMLVTARPDC